MSVSVYVRMFCACTRYELIAAMFAHLSVECDGWLRWPVDEIGIRWNHRIIDKRCGRAMKQTQKYFRIRPASKRDELKLLQLMLLNVIIRNFSSFIQYQHFSFRSLNFSFFFSIFCSFAVSYTLAVVLLARIVWVSECCAHWVVKFLSAFTSIHWNYRHVDRCAVRTNVGIQTARMRECAYY